MSPEKYFKQYLNSSSSNPPFNPREYINCRFSVALSSHQSKEEREIKRKYREQDPIPLWYNNKQNPTNKKKLNRTDYTINSL